MKLGYITREEACEALYRLINSVFLWGAEDDINDLFISIMDPYHSSEEYRTPKNIEAYEEWRQHLKELYDKYKF